MRIFIFDTSQSIDQLIIKAYQTSISITKLIQAIQNPICRFWSKEFRKTFQIAMTECKVIERRLYFWDRLYILENEEVCLQILHRTHTSPFSGHPGYVKTLDLLRCIYWWPCISQDMATFMKACYLCHRTKKSCLASPGFLKLLPIPFWSWSDISIDHVVNLPECERHGQKYKHILVTGCFLTKMWP